MLRSRRMKFLFIGAAIAIILAGICIWMLVLHKVKPKPPVSYNDWMKTQLKQPDAAVLYNMNFNFLFVEEIDSDALQQMATTDLAPVKASFNDKTKSLYFYDASQVPKPGTNIMAMYEVDNLDVRLEQDLYASSSSITVPFGPLGIETDPNNPVSIDSQARLFYQIPLTARPGSLPGDVQVTFLGTSYTLHAGQSKSFLREHGAEWSKIVVINYGTWSSKHMKYVKAQ